MESKKKYQLVIIGAGPAGMTASIYASRYKVSNIIVGEAPGGLAFEAHKICNYPGNSEISGAELTANMQKHVQSSGGETLIDKVSYISKKENDSFEIATEGGKNLEAEAILLAIGTEHRRLDLPSEKNFLGRGVSYCATCDAMFYRDKVVGVVGGSDSANTASLYLSEVAAKVYQIYRRDALRGDPTWIEKIMNNEKIEVIFNTQVSELVGKEKLEGVVLDGEYKGNKEIDLDGLFVEIGSVPREELINALEIETNKKGYIKVDEAQRTSKKNIWAAGDITDNSNGFCQIVTASSEGAVAAEDIFNFFQRKSDF